MISFRSSPMELACVDPSPFSCGVVVGRGMLFRPQQRMRMKQAQSMVPCYTIMCNTDQSRVNQRRSANYHPSIWDPKSVESFTTPYTYESHGSKLEELKREARRLLKSSRDPSVQLKLIDSIQRLGVTYHFVEEIKDGISLVHNHVPHDLHTAALQFRLLREHGYSISSAVFDKFRDRSGRFMDSLGQDVVGLLSLYEASHLGMDGEDELEEAKNFSIKHLKSLIGKMERKQAEQVQQSLETPLRWRIPRLEARNFIDCYSRDRTKSSVLLELAQLDYNLVQSVYQKELKELSKWWKHLGFKERLSFSRDRLMENYLWAMGINSEPQFSNCRKGLTKFVCILTAIDDIYDIYGSLDELERFTDAINRWDTKAMEDLPEYMKLCYLAMFNFGNEIAYDGLKDHGLNILPYIKEEWLNLCRSYLVEARWFYNGYKPTLDEYLENASTSVGGPAAIVHAYFLLGHPITEGSLDSFKLDRETIYWSSLITRLSDDLGTSKAEMVRGDVAKSIQCYMIQEGVSEEQAHDHIENLIRFSWKQLNKVVGRTSQNEFIAKMSLNMARTAQCIFQHGDGIGTSIGVTKDRLSSLIVMPISIQ
ncbi:hypothetical protein F0562_008329 [Nyssa sinensis]|uniref:Uncharacterized protein n=1 Tax=Nyssa sinensis TaxID=561372 RepID=A0A5J5A8Y5_9ASTE|nr:hypothetical protein F0562_008329 [Nyssa sinensis]